VEVFKLFYLLIICPLCILKVNNLFWPAISEIGSISNNNVVDRFFVDSITKLLHATKSVNAEPVDSMEIKVDANTNSLTRLP
jgi:hypothetical protein